jgi:hypothetical protein
MPRRRPRIALAVVFLAAACSHDAAAPVDAGASSADLTCRPDDRHAFESRASFSNGCNCCVCWEGQVVCQGAECGGAAFPPTCRTNQDCGSGVCVFNPGCDSPTGTCMGGPGICPLFVLGNMSVDQIQYCGCDGATFHLETSRQYPDRPYRHVGACP